MLIKTLKRYGANFNALYGIDRRFYWNLITFIATGSLLVVIECIPLLSWCRYVNLDEFCLIYWNVNWHTYQLIYIVTIATFSGL